MLPVVENAALLRLLHEASRELRGRLCSMSCSCVPARPHPPPASGCRGGRGGLGATRAHQPALPAPLRHPVCGPQQAGDHQRCGARARARVAPRRLREPLARARAAAGALDGWAALRSWSAEYLCAKAGHEAVTVALTPTGRADAVHCASCGAATCSQQHDEAASGAAAARSHSHASACASNSSVAGAPPPKWFVTPCEARMSVAKFFQLLRASRHCTDPPIVPYVQVRVVRTSRTRASAHSSQSSALPACPPCSIRTTVCNRSGHFWRPTCSPACHGSMR